MATPEEIIDRGLEAWRARDEEAFVQVYGDGAEIVGPGGMGLRGRDGARQFYAMWMGAFPDNEITIHNRYIAGSMVIEEGTFSGTHTGNLVSPDGQVISPTGRRMNGRYADFFAVEGDRVTRERLYFDQVELLTQLGLMPAPTAVTGS